MRRGVAWYNVDSKSETGFIPLILLVKQICSTPKWYFKLWRSRTRVTQGNSCLFSSPQSHCAFLNHRLPFNFALKNVYPFPFSRHLFFVNIKDTHYASRHVVIVEPGECAIREGRKDGVIVFSYCCQLRYQFETVAEMATISASTDVVQTNCQAVSTAAVIWGHNFGNWRWYYSRAKEIECGVKHTSKMIDRQFAKDGGKHMGWR